MVKGQEIWLVVLYCHFWHIISTSAKLIIKKYTKINYEKIFPKKSLIHQKRKTFSKNLSQKCPSKLKTKLILFFFPHAARNEIGLGKLELRDEWNNIFKKNMLFKNNMLFVSRNIGKRRYNFGNFRRDVCHLFVSFSLRFFKSDLEVTFETVSTL